MGTTAILGTVAVLGLGGVVGVLCVQNRSLERRLAEVERAGVAARTAAADAADAAAPGAPALRGIDPTAGEVKALQARVADLAKDVSRHDERLRAGAAPGTSAAAPSPDDPVFEEAVRGVVEKLLDDDGIRPKVAKAARSDEVPKKPHIDVLAKALSLDKSQDQRFREDLKDVQTELYALLAEQRPDGIVPLEEIMKAESLPEGDPGRAEMFMKLVKLQIPGSQQTYFEKAVQLAGDFRKKTTTYLRADQTDRFAHLDVDLFSVKWD